MSKSPNIFLPAIGITGLVLGGAVALSTKNFRAQEADTALRAAEVAEARADAAEAETLDIQARIEAVQIEAAARIAELEAPPTGGGPFSAPAPVVEGRFGLGRPAHDAEIVAWDVDVLPDGRGLPEGSGDVWTGEEVFADQCAACHGDFAEGVDNWPVLAGGFDTLADKDPVKTVGSYWPYLSTVWDYVHRSMPFGYAQTLSHDETYAIVAYILYSNDLVDDDFVLSHENFLDVEMHNAGGFVVDDRPELEYSQWQTEPCMENCKDSVEITMRASVLDVTPEEEDTTAETGTTTEAEPEVEVAGGEFSGNGAEATIAAVATGLDPELIAAGEGTFNKQCKSCHMVGEGAKHRVGPHLNDILGRTAGAADGFRYSGAMADAGGAGQVWDAAALEGFLSDPKGFMQGTKMNFRGLQSPEDIQAVIAYLASLGE